MFEMATKVHDERRQGEAFAPNIPDSKEYKRRFYIESYGCSMNFSDSEIVASILSDEGFGATRHLQEADLILVNTCSIREKAEQTVRKRLTEFRKLKHQKPSLLVGVLGCMAERLKSKFLEEEKLVDLVVGPDAYRSLPGLILGADDGQKGVNVLLSREETYADISPVRLNSNGITAYVSIMRGCNNMCSFCVVPFTRGRERSRDPESIIKECRDLFNAGYKEVTLLGQNVDSYYWTGALPSKEGKIDAQFLPPLTLLTGENNPQPLLMQDAGNNSDTLISEVSAWLSSPTGGDGTSGAKLGMGAITFASLLEMVALISPQLRIRFSTSHPKDITDDVLFTMAKYDNICKYIHLPLQSGSNRILQLMNRSYTREWYMAKVDRIREIMPGCGISADIIAGFCTETEEDHQDTLRVMEYSEYDLSYMFFYSERPGTLAQRRYEDDIPEEIKKRRLQQIVELQNKLSQQSNKEDVGKTFTVLIEGDSKKSDKHWMGRTSHNKVIVFPKDTHLLVPGSYVDIKVNDCTQATLLGEIA
jgi:tRNA-2-methylthio-N6-dimethylallyladenosine synthase